MSWPTVRRYPRSLAQAYPREHANPIEFYPRRSGYIRSVALAVFIGVALSFLLAITL